MQKELDNTVYSHPMEMSLNPDEVVVIKSEEGDYFTDEWNEDNDMFVKCNDDVWRDRDNCGFVESTGHYYHTDDVYWSGLMDEYILEGEGVTSYHGELATEEWFQSNDYMWVGRGTASDQWVYCDEAYYCDDIDEYVHCDDTSWCESCDTTNYEECDCNTDPECVGSYHSSSNHIENKAGVHKAKVGFEVEKVRFDDATDTGDYVGTYPFFGGYETDSSCGVEAVSHVWPLSTDEDVYTEVFKAMEDSSDIIDEEAVDSSCGGHINISHADYPDSLDLLDKVRTNLAVVYAMWRWRLKNTYCRENKEMKKQRHKKYSPVCIKSGGVLELRVPNAVKSVAQLQRRYRIIAIIMEHSLEVGPTTFDQLLSKLSNVLWHSYGRDLEKVEKTKDIARSFHKWLVIGDVDSSIEEFVEQYDND